MTEPSDKALLPAGMNDVLPPDAGFEAAAIESLIAAFSACGYERVKPPLIEFEESLLGGGGESMTGETFRLMDPVSERMLGLRADMTLQVARIATTRLQNAPRPLRLSYAGEVLRIKGSQLRPEREFGQVGAELIGSALPAADVEIINMAASTLTNMGVRELSIDLGMPTLVPAVCAGLSLNPDEAADLRMALDRKDAASVQAMKDILGDDVTETLSALLQSTGPVETARGRIEALKLDAAADGERQALLAVLDCLSEAAPDLRLTLDPVENRGFEYHTGVTFTFFAKNVRGELGRGGHYRVKNGSEEDATGMTLFMDTVFRALPRPIAADRIYLPFGTSSDEAKKLRDDGFVTVPGLDKTNDANGEAATLKCSHIWENGSIAKLT